MALSRARSSPWRLKVLRTLIESTDGLGIPSLLAILLRRCGSRPPNSLFRSRSTSPCGARETSIRW